MSNDLTRRSFVKWGTATAGATALAGLVGCAPAAEEDKLSETGETSPTGYAGEKGNGQWLTGACMNNCSCNSARCLIRVYVEDGVPLRIRTDEEEDSIGYMQRRACPRGRAQVSNQMSPARVKYPMKRKGWSPDNPNGEMRGRDEWERITWEEALDYVASEIKKTYDTYGPHSAITATWADIGDTYYEPITSVFDALGGSVNLNFGTVSLGSWPLPEIFMTGGMLSAPDFLSMAKSKLHILVGCNWVSNKAGNTGYQLDYARKQGGKIILIDPWLNQTGQAVADEWVPVIPGTDAALFVGMAYHQIDKGLYDQEYLDTYCVGFDADHMPEGADAKDNFKDYVLGTYDNEPKTPEWAEAICGVPADRIRSLAEEIAACDKVNFFAGQSTTKHPAGEAFAQVFYTFAFMHGGIGTEGNSVAWSGLHEGMSAAPYVMAGDSSNGLGKNLVNPLTPPKVSSTPNFAEIEDMNSWDNLEYTECWQSVLDGEYGRDNWPGGKKKIDIHLIFVGGYENALNSLPNTNAAIKAFRKMDFVFGADPFFTPSLQHCDIVLPIATWWEKGNLAWMNSSETVYWADRIMEPLYESKPEGWVADELSKRLGLDPKVANTMTDEERTLCSLTQAMYLKDTTTGEFAPLFTVSQDDIDEIGAAGEPQEGLMTVAELKERGCYKVKRSEGDNLTYIPFKAFYDDPAANPLATTTGKFNIYSAELAGLVNSLGFSEIAPIGKWQMGDPEHGQGAQTDEYPLLLWTPHSLRRMHTVADTVISLREAFPQECFMSTVDAEARGIKNGDTVLMSSPHGQVLRHAKVMPTIVPGAVALQDGAWTRIDEETGIDLGGNPNILQAPKASGQGSQSWTGTIVQVEKYDGPLTLDADKNVPVVMPVGVEE